MKIAFWSGSGADSGVTEQMAVLGLVLKYIFKMEVVISCNYMSNFMPEHCFERYRMDRRQTEEKYRYCHGELEYFRKLWETEYKKNKVFDTVLGQITVVPPPDLEAGTIFYYPTPKTSMYLMDVAPDSNASAWQVLEEADIVVVFLPQNRIKVQNFFEQYGSIIPKAVFLINDYQKEGDFIPRMLSGKYQISRENVGIFPYCVGFHTACEEKDLESFLKGNLRCTTHSPNYYFMKNMFYIVKVLKEKCDKLQEERETA